ncbi:MAG: glutamate-5-semialdehyde dehydrogenase [Anaerofustis sp.]
MNFLDQCLKVKEASTELSVMTEAEKNKLLLTFADQLVQDADFIIRANESDIEEAIRNKITPSLVDRLRLDRKRIEDMAQGVRDVAKLADPVGLTLEEKTMPNGLHIKKVSVPLGVIGIIYEARPNVTSDSAALCLKSGNAVVLKGGKEAILSNTAIVASLQKALKSCGMNQNFVYLIEDTSRETTNQMMKLKGVIDVLIPRGGKSLIQAVVANSSVPVIETGAGNCHVYVDESADIEMALNIIDNAKTSRPSVCNAAETLLVHEKIAPLFLPRAAQRLAEKQVELRGCEKTREILGESVIPASEADYETEYNDYILAIKIVKDVKEATTHIRNYSTQHSESIVTQNSGNAEYFTSHVDSAAVYVNASTRFTDGGEFGLGAEIGISTQKLHARGPMGLKELTSYKYIIHGTGQIR